MSGVFFNDGASTGPTDRTGDVSAYLILLKDAAGNNRIHPGVQRCGNAACTPIENIGGGQFTTTWALDTPLTVKLLWEQAEAKFRYVVNGETKEIPYPAGMTVAGPPKGNELKRIWLLNLTENCTEARKKAKMEALFDNVQVRRLP